MELKLYDHRIHAEADARLTRSLRGGGMEPAVYTTMVLELTEGCIICGFSIRQAKRSI
jgi:hypothetical protein